MVFVKGQKYTKERNYNIALARIGDKNPMWVGDKITYKGLHSWINKHKPKRNDCEDCGIIGKKLEAANISKK